jgi:hypothetical protein
LPENTILFTGSNPEFDTNALGKVEEVIELAVTDLDGASSSDTMKIVNSQIARMNKLIRLLCRFTHACPDVAP